MYLRVRIIDPRGGVAYPDQRMERERRRAFGARERAALAASMAEVLGREPDLLAAWMHGSVVRGESARDVDVALLVRAAAHPVAVAARLGVELERAAPAGLSYDVRPIDGSAPPEIRYSVVRDGILVAERDRDARILFQADAVRDYLDMKPMLERNRRVFLERVARGI